MAQTWRTEAAHRSFVTQMAMHPAYQRIIGLGPEVIPLILKELEREPAHWFWALYALTGEDPVPSKDRGKLDKMAQAWLKWGQEHGYQ